MCECKYWISPEKNKSYDDMQHMIKNNNNQSNNPVPLISKDIHTMYYYYEWSALLVIILQDVFLW